MARSVFLGFAGFFGFRGFEKPQLVHTDHNEDYAYSGGGQVVFPGQAEKPAEVNGSVKDKYGETYDEQNRGENSRVFHAIVPFDYCEPGFKFFRKSAGFPLGPRAHEHFISAVLLSL
jgi:hypothetical protein